MSGVEWSGVEWIGVEWSREMRECSSFVLVFYNLYLYLAAFVFSFLLN